MKETIKTTEIFLSLSLFLNHKTLHLWKSNIFWGNLQPSSGLPARKLGVTSSALLATWVKRIPTHKPRPPDILHPMPGDIQPQPKPELVSLGDSWGKKSVKQIIHPPTPRSASVTIVEVKWFSYTHEDIKKPTWIICLVFILGSVMKQSYQQICKNLQRNSSQESTSIKNPAMNHWT